MRASSGFPVTFYDNSDNSLMGTLGNGVNNSLLDTPNYAGGPLNVNTNGRNGRAAFNTSQFSVEELGQLGNTPRRFFYGPGQINFGTVLSKTTALREGILLDLRLETFNTFNHAQFFGPATVAAQIQDSNFGRIVSASPPRLIQIAAKASF
jgi:hypothetical protein